MLENSARTDIIDAGADESTTGIIDSGSGTAGDAVESDRFIENGKSESGGTVQSIDEPIRDAKPATLNGIPLISPIEFTAGRTINADPNGSEPPARRRGRPPGSRNRTTTERETAAPQSTISLGGIDEILFSLHFMASQFLAESELAINEDESRKLSRAIQNVAKHYAVNIDPKKVALFNLVTVAGGIYGPRALRIYNKRKESKPKTAAQVVEMPKRETTKTQSVPNKPVNWGEVTPSMLDMTSPLDGFDQ